MNSQSRPKAIIAAAVDYARRGWSVFPLKGDKHPAVPTWKNCRTHRASPDEVREWFGRVGNVGGIGIALGAISGNLAVRDFDDLDGYARWSEAHPELAKTLPTVRTARGFHVYFRAGGVKTKEYDDGELRGELVYIAAPPSNHPDGPVYSWAIPLPEGDVPEVCPTAAGFDRCWTTEAPSRATERTEWTEKAETTEGTERTETPEDTEDPEAIARGWNQETKDAIQAAIARTLPTGFGRRNGAVFKLARALKAIPVLAARGNRVRPLKPIVAEWHRRGTDKMTTKDFGTTWGDFAHAWSNVKFPEGADVLGKALEAAEAAIPPAWAADYEPRQRLLASVCRELQRRTGNQPFFLGVRTAGLCIGADHATVGRWFKAFIADGMLLEIVKGTKATGRATRWRYVGKDLRDSNQTEAA